MRVLILTMLALLAFAPIAAAQEQTNETEKINETPTRPDDAAWVDDCPPDMMCAAGAGDEPEQLGSDGCIECSQAPVDDGNVSRGPSDGTCEYCRGEETPNDGGTCMDGASENEICDHDACDASWSSADACGRDVQYLDGGSGGPINSHAESESAKSVPGASFAIVVAAFGLAIYLLARRG